MAKVLADMHVPPALRRWSIRIGLALIVAGGIAWIPGGGDARAIRQRRQLRDLRTEAADLRAGNARLLGEVEALRDDPRAIEDHARDELGMVYPGEMVLRLESDGADTTPAAAATPAPPAAAPTEAAP